MADRLKEGLEMCKFQKMLVNALWIKWDSRSASKGQNKADMPGGPKESRGILGKVKR